MLNEVILHGRLGRDPELRKSSAGASVTTISICVERDVDKYAEHGQNKVDWIEVTFWDKAAENICRYCTKGTEIEVIGRLEVHKFTDPTKHGLDKDREKLRVKGVRYYFCGQRPRGKANPEVEMDELPDDGPDLPF